MPRSFSRDIRWLVLYKRLFRGKTAAEVTAELEGSVCEDTQSEWLRRFAATGDVVDTQSGRRGTLPANKQATPEVDLLLFQLAIDSPDATLTEQRATLELSTGIRVHLSTVCRAMRRLGLTRQRLGHFAAQRDAQRAQAFWTELLTFWDASQICVLDETAKDLSVFRRSWGYGIRGQPPIAPDAAPLRDMRVSSLCAFTLDGFVDWRHTTGTFTRALFNLAIMQMFCPQGRPQSEWITARTPLVLIDNASIHHSDEFVRIIGSAGGGVKFLPPYCWDLSPLDNGAFGMVVRWMAANRERLVQLPLERALDLAFTHAVNRAGAHVCFRNCGYVPPYHRPGS